MGCQNVTLKSNRFEAMLPAKFESDNPRSVQVRLNENLSSYIRSRGVSGIDIFGLVSYICHDKYTIEEINKDLYYAKKYIINTLNYDEFYVSIFDEQEEKVDYTSWLKKFKKQRETNECRQYPNEILNDKILLQYIFDFPPQKWIDEGVSINTLIEFQVGVDIQTERIIFPIHNSNGELIGVKGRYFGQDKKIEEEYKYLYLHPCDKSKELFNLHRALPYIKQQKEVIVVEGAKTTMIAWSHGIKNIVSIEGDHITKDQIKLLKNLGIDVTLTFAWDKGKDKQFIREQLKQIKGRLIYVLYDTKGYFEDKDSPLDKGIEVFKKLYENCRYKFGG